MNLIEKIFEKLHISFRFLNRANSPSQKIQIKDDGKIEGDIILGDKLSQPSLSFPTIKVLPKTAVSDFKRYNHVNVYIEVNSKEPLYILECIFDGIPLSSESRRLDQEDVLHFEDIDQNRMVDGYEPGFLLKIRTQDRKEFLFQTKLRIKLFINRYDLQVPTGNETIREIHYR